MGVNAELVQAMRLIERTINHYSGAGEQIEKRAAEENEYELEAVVDETYFGLGSIVSRPIRSMRRPIFVA